MASIAKPLQIFRAGSQTDSIGRTLTFAASDLEATARAYDPQKHEAPLVVGHPATDAPAYGWAERLAVDQGALEALPCQVDPQFAEMVNAGRFKRISSSFWMPDAPGNPVPGVYYLRHIGFLGAVPPAVKGLRTPQFSGDAEGIVTIEFSTVPEPPMADNTADFAAREAALAKTEAELKAKADAQTAEFAERDQSLKAREAAIAKVEAEARRKEAAEFAETHVKAGRLLPRQKASLTELLLALPVAPLEFADDGKTIKSSAREVLEHLIESLPVQVDFAERSAAEPRGADHSAQFNAPAGWDVDADRLALHQKATALAAAQKITYAQALAQVAN
jgi:hypothetical protein